MNIKTNKRENIEMRFPFDSLNIETVRAAQFLVNHIRRGIAVKDAYTMMESSYGFIVAYQVLVVLKRTLN